MEDITEPLPIQWKLIIIAIGAGIVCIGLLLWGIVKLARWSKGSLEISLNNDYVVTERVISGNIVVLAKREKLNASEIDIEIIASEEKLQKLPNQSELPYYDLFFIKSIQIEGPRTYYPNKPVRHDFTANFPSVSDFENPEFWLAEEGVDSFLSRKSYVKWSLKATVVLNGVNLVKEVDLTVVSRKKNGRIVQLLSSRTPINRQNVGH